MTTAVLSLLVLASALLNIRAEYKGPRRQVYVFKPLTVVLVILIALQTKFAAAPPYKQLIVAGLLCSLAGDVLLIWPRERFVAGLVCFLFAHVCYIAAFTVGSHSCLTPTVRLAAAKGDTDDGGRCVRRGVQHARWDTAGEVADVWRRPAPDSAFAVPRTAWDSNALLHKVLDRVRAER